MLNLKKISQAMLIACALSVVSYYPSPVFAADEDVEVGGSTLPEVVVSGSDVISARRTSLQDQQAKIKAQENDNKAAKQAAEDAYSEALYAANKKVSVAQKAYENCTDDCGELYKALQAAKNQSAKDIKEAKQVRKDALQEVKKAEKSKELKAEKKAAKAEEKQLNKEKKSLTKQSDKAKKDIEKAQNKVEKYCKEGGNQEKCQKATAELNTAQQTLNKVTGQLAVYNSPLTTQQPVPEAEDSDAPSNPRKEAYEKAKAADEKYQAARDGYSKAAEDLAKLQYQCIKENTEDCSKKIEDAKQALADAKTAADDAYKEKTAAERESKKQGAYHEEDSVEAIQEKVDSFKAGVKASEDKIADYQNKLKEAKAACEHSKKLRSKQGQKDAQKYCGMQEQLEAQLAAEQENLAGLKSDLASLEQELAEARKKAIAEGRASGLDMRGMEYKAFSTAQGDIAAGTYTGNIDYSNTGDVFSTITRRAARILVGLKPLVYTFAGFGLIAFAYMAIFNKISWKWFANIAIGLFLVANMGRLIEFMVYPDSGKDGGWQSSPQPLASFGDYLDKGFADTEYEWVEEISPYAPQVADGDKPDTTITPIGAEEAEAATRKFCGKTGASGWGNFKSCVGDLISAGKKGVDALKKAKSTVDTVKSTVENVTGAAKNIGAAAEAIGNAVKGKGSLESIFYNVGNIGKNMDFMVGSVGGALGTTTDNIISIGNNIQDMSKSVDEQRELKAKRDRGEATNKFNAALMGQTIGTDGNAERRWGGDMDYDADGNVVLVKSGFAKETFEGINSNGERVVGVRDVAVEGDIASNKKSGINNGKNAFLDAVDKVTNRSKSASQTLQDATGTVGAGVEVVANFSAFGSKSINQARNDRYQAKQHKVQQNNAAKAESKNAAAPAPAPAANTASIQTKAIQVQSTNAPKANSQTTSANNASAQVMPVQQTAEKAINVEAQQSNNTAVAAAGYTSGAVKAQARLIVKAPVAGEPKPQTVQVVEGDKSSAEVASQQYVANNTPSKIALAAKNKLAKAQAELDAAKSEAAAKVDIAAKAEALAQEAVKKAQKTNNSADLARAAELQKRAQLANAEAQTAQAIVTKAETPLQKLKEEAKMASLNEAKYDKEKYKKSMEGAEMKIKDYRIQLAEVQRKVQDAYIDAQNKIEAAKADGSKDNVLAARAAYKQYETMQKEMVALQKRMEGEIRERAQAENNYNAAITKQNQLER